MRVAVLSYPMLFQRMGGLQVQVRETVTALQGIGIDARLFDINAERLVDYDIVHIFSAINGVWRIAETAKSVGKPVIVSSVLHGSDKFAITHRARLASWLTSHITGWEYATAYDQTRRTLELADRVLALGQSEAKFIACHFVQPSEKILIVPNGIARRFFAADPNLFPEKFGIAPGYILSTAGISPYKNQLGLVQAARGLSARVVLIGPCSKENESYLANCLEESQGQAIYLGVLSNDDPVLASAYAAAGVTALPSRTEVMPFTILESLAAGTPAIVTRHQSLGLESRPPLYFEVDPEDINSIRSALNFALRVKPSPEACRSLVAHLEWPNVARMIEAAYRNTLENQ